MYLDADNHAAVFDELGEWSAVVCLLVQGFVEDDDPANTAVDALVGCEEQLAVATPVLLCVLHPDGVETFRHAACRQHTHTHTHTYRSSFQARCQYTVHHCQYVLHSFYIIGYINPACCIYIYMFTCM